jgi:hypothetical protein
MKNKSPRKSRFGNLAKISESTEFCSKESLNEANNKYEQNILELEIIKNQKESC